jgi:exodeoxyribonuclease V alpha subunit
VTDLLRQLREAGYFTPLDVQFAETLGRLSNCADALALLGAAAASRFAQYGHACLDIPAVAGRPIETGEEQLDGGLAWPEAGPWIEALQTSGMVARSQGGADEPAAPLLLDEAGRLYLLNYFVAEEELSRELLRRAALPPDAGVDAQLLERDQARLFGGTAEEDGQRAAARTAVLRRLVIVTGGPGTGKTSTVAKILCLLFSQAVRRGARAPRVVLMTPTGKAAARLTEALRASLSRDTEALGLPEAARQALGGLVASTIHRALGAPARGYGRFRRGADNPLPVEVVVVDEASMVDLPLMARLLAAVPSEARLLLLGDQSQLVSVEVGSVLGDICAGSPEAADAPLAGCIQRLTHSFRFCDDAGIGALARAINAGDADRAVARLRASPDLGVRWIEASEASAVEAALAPLAREHYAPALAAADPGERLRRLSAFRVLCAHRRGPFGVEALNPLLERLLFGSAMGRRQSWYHGRPVMVQKNDPALGLFNGDVGVIARDAHSGKLRAVFPGPRGSLRSFSPAVLPEHETVFAMTVHKSQGSEFERVAVVLPDRPSPVLTRELLYTAVTRARAEAIIIGSEAVVRHAVCTPVRRFSGLRERLWGNRRREQQLFDK